MRLRRFEGATVAEALARVRADLGPEAVILHTRAADPALPEAPRGGWVEVMAAVDEQPHATRHTPRDEGRRVTRSGFQSDAERCAREGVAEALSPQAPEPFAPWEGQPSEGGRIEEMYRMLMDLRDKAATTPRLPEALRPLYRELCGRELPAGLARRLLLELPGHMRARRGEGGRAALQTALSRSFRVRGLTEAGRRQRVLALVGPTGVGKTTTIAKLAGQYRKTGGLRVALVSLDTYRIGAMAQMQIYAELLKASLHVVRTPAELETALRVEREADLILLDSMGRSPRHREGIAALRPFLRRVPDLEVHLVVSATTKGSDLEEILRRFQPLMYQHVVITKLDEVGSPGPLLGLALQQNLSISYLATGQEVPDDLEPATPRRLAGFLVPDGADSGSRAAARA